MNEHRRVLWSALAFTVAYGAYTELRRNETLNPPRTQMTSQTAAISELGGVGSKPDHVLRRANLRVEAIHACQSLPQEQLDAVVSERTPFDSMQQFTEHADATRALGISQVNELNFDREQILEGCLRARNLPGDSEKADYLATTRGD